MFLVFQKRERCNTHTHRRGDDDDDDKGRSMFLSEVYFVLCIPSLSPPPNFLFLLREKNNIERDAVEASRFFFQFLFQNKF